MEHTIIVKTFISPCRLVVKSEVRRTMSVRSKNLNSVFYADSYHPIQAGSIDGTDVVPHDNAVYRAQLCSSIGLCLFFLRFSFSFFKIFNFGSVLCLKIEFCRWPIWWSQGHWRPLLHSLCRSSLSPHHRRWSPQGTIFFCSM